LSSIAERLAQVRSEVRTAARRADRDPQAVRLLAVSKTKPVAAIDQAYQAGQRDFGENYAQELAEKARALADYPDIRWHMLGHLQRNKAKLVAEHASVVHSVDSVQLVDELGKRLAGRRLPSARQFVPGEGCLVVLVQVNVGAEDQKAGCPVAELGDVLDAVARQPDLALRGLMAIPPLGPDLGAARDHFETLVRLRDEHGGEGRLPELSMGMSQDFVQAIESGATLVRVGTGIFGARERPEPAS
jgi:pyridoxal phosphate enzyme (YggS family)